MDDDDTFNCGTSANSSARVWFSCDEFLCELLSRASTTADTDLTSSSISWDKESM